MLDFTRGKLKNQTGEQSNATLLSHLSFFKTRFSNQSYIYNICMFNAVQPSGATVRGF